MTNDYLASFTLWSLLRLSPRREPWRNAHLARASLMESGVRANKSMPLKSVPIAGISLNE